MNPYETTPVPDRQTSMLFVQSIKGAPASVLLALAFAGREMSHGELMLWTRCGHRQITAALRTLEACGWIIPRTERGPWRLSPDRQLPVGCALLEGSALRALSSSSDSLNLTREETPLPSALGGQLHETIRACGIREPTASELAALPHMNIQYLQAHMAAARAHGLRIGAAIQAMRLGAPPPDGSRKHDRQAEVQAKIRRFMEGP